MVGATSASYAQVNDNVAALTARAIAPALSGPITYTWSCVGPSPVTFSANDSSLAGDTMIQFTQPGSYAVTCVARCGTVQVSKQTTIQNVMLTIQSSISEIASEQLSIDMAIKQYSVSVSGKFSDQPLQFAWKIDDVAIVDAWNMIPSANPRSGVIRICVGPGTHSLSCTVTSGTIAVTSTLPLDLTNSSHYTLLEKKSWIAGREGTGLVANNTLSVASPRLVRAQVGDTVECAVRGLAKSPVTFVALSGGSDVSGNRVTIVVQTDATGNARANFLLQGEVMEILALSNGERVRFVVYRQ